MKIKNRIISILSSICMLITLLPAHIALATEDDIADYLYYADTLGDIPTDYSGHIVRLEKADESAAYDYSLTVSAYNMTATNFHTALKFDSDDVSIVTSAGKAYTAGITPFSNYVTHGTITASMVNAEYVDVVEGESLVGYLFAAVEDDTQILSKDTESSYYKIYKYYSVNRDVNTVLFTNSDTGALAEKSGSAMAYTTPTNVLCDLYTLYFNVKSDKEITADTFGIYYESTDGFHGGAAILIGSDTLGITNSEGVYFVGFPKPTVPDQTVNFTKVQDKNGSGLSGAEIKIYSDSAKTDLVDTITTNNGTASATLGANTTYYYTVSLANYQDATGTFSVGSSTATVDTITLTSNSDVTYNTAITVKDADTGAALSGASVTVDGTAVSGITDENGQITAQLTATSHSATASLNRYQTSSAVDFTVSKTGANTATISLVPERASVTLPAINDGNGGTVSDASVVITKTTTDNPTNEWSTTNTKTYSAGDTMDLPKGNDYTMTIAAGGYSSQTIYLSVDSDGNVIYYSDSSLTNEINPSADGITITKLEDPYYQVDVTQGDDGKTFTAAVTLNNIASTYGTFGLRYDKDVFDFDSSTGFTLGSNTEIKLFNPDPTAPESSNVVVQSSDTDKIGYYVFSWQSLGVEEGIPFDATSGKAVATYTFTLKEGKSVSDITSDAFSVMPYDKTSAGVAYINTSDDIDKAREYLNGLWRYVDEENEESSLGVGRLEKSKATLNGFHQVFVNSIDGTEDADCMFDVMTNIKYTNFDAAKASLNFVITDEDNVPLDNASVKLYNADGNAVTTLTTGSTGIASYPVSGSAEYQYTVSCLGYWDKPETGMNTVSVTDKETTNEYVELEQKIYHETELQDSNDAVITGATLSGDLYAYNNRDYHFNIKPDTGKKLNPDVPVELVAVVEGQTCPVEYESSSNTYVLKAQYVTGDPTLETPDGNGFPSEKIVIKMVSGEIIDSNETYTVTAHAGTHGSVTYDKGTTTYPADTGSTSSEITVSNITPNDSIGKFTFTAEGGYMVEKVIVNGVQIHDYDNKTEFEYSDFTNITMDNDITVTFWDGKNPSTDAVVTLVVGPNGTATVSHPDNDTVRDTRKTYIYTGGTADTLDFTLTADNGYSVVSVEKSVNGGVNEAVTQSGENYSVDVAQGDVTTVYVTFDTSTVFVTAYVKEGEGTIDPVGVLIMNMYDSPAFTMTAKDTDWSASAVDVNGNEISNTESNAQTFTYTVQSITQDTSVGAIFKETSYKVTGVVDLSQGKNLTQIDVQLPAIVTCTRQSDGMLVTVYTTRSRTGAAFEAPLPKGTWDIQVSKVGYINYTITGFEVDGASDVAFGKKADGSIQKITPYIGNTSGTGKTVSLTDAGVVANGLRANSSAATKAKADVDDDGNVSATADMSYIKFNYGQRAVTKSYSDFLGE